MKFNIRISGQVEADSVDAARRALGAHLIHPEAEASPLLDGGILRVLPDASDPVAVAQHELLEAEAQAERAQKVAERVRKGAEDKLAAAKKAVAQAEAEAAPK